MDSYSKRRAFDITAPEVALLFRASVPLEGQQLIDLKELEKSWNIYARPLLESDGNNPKLPSGGYRIKGNEALIEIINKIRDGYWQIFSERPVRLKSDSESLFQVRLKDYKYDRIMHTYESYQALTTTNAEHFKARDAQGLIGQIIKYAVYTYDAIFPCEQKDDGPSVPSHIEIWRRPELQKLPVHRSRPRGQNL